MIRKTIKWGVLATLLFGFVSHAYAQKDEIVASLDRLDGRVQIIQAETGKTIQGRNGLLLKAGDTVETKAKTRVTIKFRDGSEVRMFPDSRFVIQHIKESQTKVRSFSYKLFLKVGSIWGKFTPQRNLAEIIVPTATIGIKGTALRAVHRKGKSRVALTEGKVEVTNNRGKVDLVPGKRLENFTQTDDLRKKLTDIPYKIDIKSEKHKLQFNRGKAEEVFVTLQMVDIKKGSEVRRAGRVYFRSNYDRIVYPPSANLNQRGYARVPLKFLPPESTDEKHDGNIYVWALIDEENADDTAEGRILFTFPVKSGKENIRIESDSGEGKRVQK